MISDTPNSKISPKMKHSKKNNKNNNVNVPDEANPSRTEKNRLSYLWISHFLVSPSLQFFLDNERINRDIDHEMSPKISIFFPIYL